MKIFSVGSVKHVIKLISPIYLFLMWLLENGKLHICLAFVASVYSISLE